MKYRKQIRESAIGTAYTVKQMGNKRVIEGRYSSVKVNEIARASIKAKGEMLVKATSKWDQYAPVVVMDACLNLLSEENGAKYEIPDSVKVYLLHISRSTATRAGEDMLDLLRPIAVKLGIFTPFLPFDVIHGITAAIITRTVWVETMGLAYWTDSLGVGTGWNAYGSQQMTVALGPLHGPTNWHPHPGTKEGAPFQAIDLSPWHESWGEQIYNYFSSMVSQVTQGRKYSDQFSTSFEYWSVNDILDIMESMFNIGVWQPRMASAICKYMMVNKYAAAGHPVRKHLAEEFKKFSADKRNNAIKRIETKSVRFTI